MDTKFRRLNEELKSETPRDYLGLSQIGEQCHRKLQYYHYWAYNTEISSRIQRLFNVGHSAEECMTQDLLKIGIFISEDQKEIVGTAGHWKGHIDGIGFSPEDGDFLVEFKTHNDKSFKDFSKMTVKAAKPMHYDQMTAYMGYLGLPKALYMALNKNDSTYYFEWVPFDEERYNDLLRKELEVISAEVLLPKIGTGSPTWFACKMCDAKDVCHKGKQVEVNCRTCKHVDVMDDGKWHCSYHNAGLSNNVQKEGCIEYKVAEMFKL